MMHEDAPTAEVAWFLRQAADALPANPPTPGPELAVLLAEGLPAPALPAPAQRPTRRSTMRSTLSGLPARLALAAGLTFAGAGLGAAVGLPTPFQLASEHGEVTDPIEEVVTDPIENVTDPIENVTDPVEEVVTDPVQDVVTDPVEDVVTDPVDEVTPDPTDEIPAAPVDGDAPLPAAPTSVSEAARIHAFDEACGNHGRYVSFFARNGTEPPCATALRNGTTTPPVPTDGTDDGGDDTDGDTPAGAAGAKGGKPADPGSQGGAKRAGR